MSSVGATLPFHRVGLSPVVEDGTPEPAVVTGVGSKPGSLPQRRPPKVKGPVQIQWETLPPVPPVGSHPLDLTPLSAAPSTRHLHRALVQPGLEMRHVFDRSKLKFKEAPDPTHYLRELQRVNAERPVPSPSTELRVMTYNTGLLDFRITLEDVCRHIPVVNLLYLLLFPLLFWFKFVHVHVKAPHLDARRFELPPHILATGDDVVMLQEVWRERDVATFAAAAKKRGYIPIAASRTPTADGLMILVRRDIVDGNEPIMAARRFYEAQMWGERVGNVRRGYLRVRFTHKTLGPVTVFNTHMQSYPDKWMQRSRQSRELGLAAQEAHKLAPDGLVLLGGDLNSAPFYANDFWNGDRGVVPDFYANTVANAILAHYSGLSDAVVAGRSASEADDDVELSRRMAQVSSLPVYPFTGSSLSNSLYAQQYRMDEPPARLDHIFANTSERVRVMSSQLAFTDDVQLGASRAELSDHYALRTTLRVAIPQTPRRAITQPVANPILHLAPTRPAAGGVVQAGSQPPEHPARRSSAR